MAIAITVRYTHEEKQHGLFSYGLLVEVLSATDMTDKIFVIQRGVASATDTEVNDPGELDTFQWIASPLELDQYPEGAPDLQNQIPYYRTNSVRFSFRSMDELVDTLALIKSDIEKLVGSLKAELALESVEEIVYD
jgi:hypothetical protein